MAKYVDGFVIPIPKKNLKAYRALAKKAGKIWMEHGALSYMETVGDDIKTGFGVPFPKLAKLKPNETVLFSWIVYKSRADRKRVMKKVMSDPRLEMDPKSMPFDFKKMTMGGFAPLVDL